MSQRKSGYKRRANDLYETPKWVTWALIPHLPIGIKRVWEPACGSGKIVDVLKTWGFDVTATDKGQGICENSGGLDFFDYTTASVPPEMCNAIITNPPFDQAQEFIEHALKLMKPNRGVVAMLLRNDFDSAKTRAHLFGYCPQWARKVVLTRRIVWFPKKGAAPSYNHSWYLWDYGHTGPATLEYHYETDPT